MQSIGRIAGRTSTHAFSFKVSNKVSKWDYITLNHVEVGPVLGQVTEIMRSASEAWLSA